MTELPDRLLRDALRPGAPVTPSNVCVDAEALAAWADGTMSGAARAAFEVHAADCARCQALMAAMARTEPPSIEPPWWRRAVFSWMMPLAAATAAIVVVSLTITQRRAPAPQTARLEPAAATPSRAEDMAASRAAAPSAPAPAAPQATASAKADARRERDAIAPTVRRQDQPKDAAGLPNGKTEPRATDANANAAPVLAQSPPPALPPPATTPPSAPPSAAPTRELAAQAPAAAAGAAVSADASRSNRFSARDELRMKAVASPLLVIASPARDSQWRIVGGAVGHTEDGGVTWQTQALGVDVPVRAGAAPAARVCWLAGAGGLVLLTTDGVHWRRITFPESVDLVAIEATDASHATVTTATGGRFSTADGGQTWTSR